MITRKPRFPIKAIILYGFWPSFVKRILYRIRGYHIGEGVKIGFGSVICGEEVSIGDFCEIGFFSFVRGKRLQIEKRVSIGSATMIDTPYLKIGEETKINEQVFIGGLQFPDSRLTIGKHCQIMQMTFINPAKWITIGDDTGIGGDTLIFGHTTWLSKFEGYPADFKPIEIGNSVSIAWRVFVGAGAKIGNGAVIGANSLVTRTIPERCLATGSPAKVVAKAPYFPRVVSDEEKGKYLREILEEMILHMQGNAIVCEKDEALRKIVIHYQKNKLFGSSRKSGVLQVEYDEIENRSEAISDIACNAFLSLRAIPEKLREKLVQQGIAWIDIENKERADLNDDLASETAHYLRRFGVRFTRK